MNKEPFRTAKSFMTVFAAFVVFAVQNILVLNFDIRV
jgi:hypothetical protein